MADWWDSTGAKLGGTANNQSQAPQAGQFANNQQGFLDWATKQYGADPQRGQGFVNAQAGGGLQKMLSDYAAATGNTANFQGGPSGDRVDFGQGAQDALTSGGQIWNPAGGSGGGNAGGGGGSLGLPAGRGGGYGGGQGYSQPDPFTYQKSTLGQFQGYGNVPGAPQLNYNQQQMPQDMQAQQYNGITAEQAKADPSYQFRLDQTLGATNNTLAHSGALRTGNAVSALQQQAGNFASQEYAAADARARGNVQQNNAVNLAYGAQNFNQGFQANQANNQNALNFGNANFNNQLAAQGQGFGQAATAYGLNQGAQNQDFQQALAAYAQNTNTGLGYGNLGLGYQNSAQNYALGQGGLGIQQGNLDLARNGQNFNQNLASYQQNYQTGLDDWNHNYQLATLGNPGQPNSQGNANQQSDLYTQQGNANAAGSVGSANAWRQGLSGLANAGQSALGYWNSGQPQRQLYQSGYGMPLYNQ